MRIIFTIIYIFLISSLLCAQTPDAPPDSEKALVHFGDLIDVDVLGSTEYDWRGTITPEGFLSNLEFADQPVAALCRNENEIARDVEKSYAKLLRNPQVVVKILDRSGRPASILFGAVRMPQRFQIERPVKLSELVVLAGGITEQASGEIQIFRPQNLSCADVRAKELLEADKGENKERFVAAKQEKGSTYIKVRIADLVAGMPDANPQILTGDVVTVLEAAPIYIIGGVASPKQISSRSEMTISRAIASAGGFAKGADQKKITVFRRGKNGTNVIDVDFDKIKTKQSEDFVLQAYDVIEVGQSGREKRKYPPVIRVEQLGDKNTLNLPLRTID